MFTKMTKNSIALALVSLVGVMVIGGVILESIGRSATGLFGFALAVIPMLIVQLYQGEKQAQDSAQIKESVNGNLTKQLEDVKAHTSQVVSIATRTRLTDLERASNATNPSENSDPS